MAEQQPAEAVAEEAAEEMAEQQETEEETTEETESRLDIPDRPEDMTEEELVEYARKLEMTEQQEEVLLEGPSEDETPGAMAAQTFEELTAGTDRNLVPDLAGVVEKATIINGHVEQESEDDLDLDSLEFDLKKIVVQDSSDNGKTGSRNITELEDMNLDLDDYIALNGPAAAGEEDPDHDDFAMDKKGNKTSGDSGNADNYES